MNALPSPLLVVTDRRQSPRPLEETVRDAVEAGARWVWLRDRDLECVERRRLAFRLAKTMQGVGGRLTVGDDIELAADVGACGVQVRNIPAIVRARRLLGNSALIGLSAHSLEDVAGAKHAGADYVTLSPIHASASKPGYGPPLGDGAIVQAARTGISVVALGGITAENAAAAFEAGAAAVAVMGTVMRQDRPARTVRLLLAAARSLPVT